MPFVSNCLHILILIVFCSNQNGVPNVSPSQPGTAPTSASHSSNKGVVVSIVVLVLILCIVILLIVVILYKRDRR